MGAAMLRASRRVGKKRGTDFKFIELTSLGLGNVAGKVTVPSGSSSAVIAFSASWGLSLTRIPIFVVVVAQTRKCVPPFFCGSAPIGIRRL
jgi:hypothetical protein